MIPLAVALNPLSMMGNCFTKQSCMAVVQIDVRLR